MLFDFFLSLLSTLHGQDAYTFLFALLLAAAVGGPLSQDLLLLAAASFTMGGGLQPLPLVAQGWMALLAGDALTFWSGHALGARWIRMRWAGGIVRPQQLPAAEAAVRRWAPVLAFVTRFLPGQRATLFFLAGTFRMPYRPFLLADGLAALLHVPLLVYGVRLFHWRWQEARPWLERADDVLTLGLLAVLVLLWWIGRRRRA